jgi:hypothetical protein
MKIFERVEKNYKDNFEKLGDRRFHFASRIFLWSRDEFAKNKLAQLKAGYIGTNEGEYAEKIKNILSEDFSSKNLLFKRQREVFFAKYPALRKYNKVLFRNLFCETIYGLSLREIIGRQIKKEELIELRNDLWNDREAIAALSTHAINYFYVLDYYLNEEETFFDPAVFLELVETENIFKDKNTAALKVYLLTHCIIGESAFYARNIERHKKSYEKIFLKLEKIIEENYTDVSLDNKVEFLVCAKLCGKSSFMEEKILEDTEESFNVEGNYFTENGKIKSGDSFRSGEHRSVLALLAFYLKDK